MKLYEAFFLSLLLSLLTGALIFLGIPLAWELISSDIRPDESYLTTIGLVLYIIYGIIQFWLSAINLIQAIYMESKGRLDIDKDAVTSSFYMAEAILYCVVFIGLAIACGNGEVIVFILGFSVLYIICCTVSICYFRYFLKMVLKRDKAMEENKEEIKGETEE